METYIASSSGFAVSESSYKIKLLCLYLYLFYPFLIIVETNTERYEKKSKCDHKPIIGGVIQRQQDTDIVLWRHCCHNRLLFGPCKGCRSEGVHHALPKHLGMGRVNHQLLLAPAAECIEGHQGVAGSARIPGGILHRGGGEHRYTYVGGLSPGRSSENSGFPTGGWSFPSSDSLDWRDKVLKFKC